MHIVVRVPMTNNLKSIGWCSMAISVALYVVGAVSHIYFHPI
jgi:hypothetical protein